jgi:hypothetical protein
MGYVIFLVIVWYLFIAFLAFLYHYFRNTVDVEDRDDRRAQSGVRALAWPADLVKLLTGRRTDASQAAPSTASATDADMAGFYRSMDAARVGPSMGGENATNYSKDDLASIVRKMADDYGARQFGAVWTRRASLNTVLPSQMTRDDWFWLNAYGALSALQLGQRDHPLTATSGGYADDAVDRDNPGQAAAVAEIHQRYFGRKN